MKSEPAQPSLWHELVSSRPGRASHALRITACCILSCLLVQYYQTPEAALSVYIVFFLVKPDRLSSIVQSIAAVLLMGFIVGLLLLIIQQVIDEPVLRLASMAALSLFFMFAALASKLRPVASILALIFAYTLDLVCQAFIGELATRALLYGWLAAIIPAGVCLSLSLLCAPGAGQLLRQTLAYDFRLAAARLQQADHASEAWREALQDDQSQIQQWLKLSAKERDASDLPQLQCYCATLGPLFILIEQLGRTWSPLPGGLSTSQLAQFLTDCGNALEARQTLPDFPQLSAADARNRTLCELARLFRFISTNTSADDVAELSVVTAQPVTGFWLADAFSNPDYPRLALKTTAAAMSCYLIYSLLDWPGIHTSLITCYIVALASTAETLQKLRLRLIGCLIGSVAGIATILLIMPQINSLAFLLVLIALSSLAAAWVAAGSSRIAYAGLQIAFAYYLCVLQGHGPAFDLVIPRDRVIGIVLGLLVVYLIFVHIWPVSLARQIDSGILQAQALFARLCQSDQNKLTQHQRYGLLNQIAMQLNLVQRAYALITLEPVTVRPTQEWLQQRQHLLHSLQLLCQQLLMTSDCSDTSMYQLQHLRQLRQVLLQLAELLPVSSATLCSETLNTVNLQLHQFTQRHANPDCLSHETLQYPA
ncbi:FUSC family protein [Undibacterium crateris]|uniref:FUSC family protein n=1 Tax=Undibacterium crateris TaxID=2528175 RepID=UPI001389EA6E|nr:FUSC family protein [Undibacterium crateris]NDI85393.1 FUSC family protein [Undibacterium crateris]